ncbi:unnamed protein product [Caenorhabditis angaria]|uniref:LisH domain-containing protein n=1 Tax=Caenorhabditis angaria TaxID=860376 RepID=A0A9P1MTI2_9PELO|nr:unnamed protein product [Caenorhabditis angaria]
MRESYKSRDQIAETVLKSSDFGTIREIVRYSVNSSLNEHRTKHETEPRVYEHKERVIHSLVQSWLNKNGYPLAAIAMKCEMNGNLIENPERYIVSGELFENNLRLQSEKNLPPVNSEKEIWEQRELPLIEKEEKDVINIRRSQETLEKSMKQRIEKEVERKNRIKEKSDDESEKSSSDETTSATSDNDTSSSSGTDEPKNWGPSKIELVTDKMMVDSEKKEQFDERKTVEVKREEIEEGDLEELKFPEDDSVDELDDFDTGLLSSGGSDISF